MNNDEFKIGKSPVLISIAVGVAFWRERESCIQQNRTVNDTVTVAAITNLMRSSRGTAIIIAPMAVHRREMAGISIKVIHYH